ncbi:hypothetical protein EDB81DRAFT_168545 [Dactylonectria macrodidyma]|uniref:Uncharacterized protein n=1 Tax=Dactylonectria macrodidyma TaxID=307937 RepID=A0A9P9JGR5_9HYPO|nr:hypothetical protein EDB81DRAFT_168545 [Dactylonectria macrodidyma]
MAMAPKEFHPIVASVLVAISLTPSWVPSVPTPSGRLHVNPDASLPRPSQFPAPNTRAEPKGLAWKVGRNPLWSGDGEPKPQLRPPLLGGGRRMVVMDAVEGNMLLPRGLWRGESIQAWTARGKERDRLAHLADKVSLSHPLIASNLYLSGARPFAYSIHAQIRQSHHIQGRWLQHTS